MTTTAPPNVSSPVAEPSLAVAIGKLRLQNPMMTASGTCGYANEYGDFTDLSQLGAFVTKAISKTPRKGNESIRVIETRAGMLNAIGLANIGLDAFLRDKIPLLKKMGVPVIVNVPGWCIEDYVDVAAALDQQETVGGIELNVSCPNVHAGGMAFGSDPGSLEYLVSRANTASTRPLIVKLSPNVTSISHMAKIAADAGADAVSMVNTFLGMAIDAESRRPRLTNVTGGLWRFTDTNAIGNPAKFYRLSTP